MIETQSSRGKPPVVLLAITITVLLIWAGRVILSNPFLEDLCGNKILSESKSPDGLLKAVVFERDCGATTGFSTQLSVLKYADSLPNDGGNIFVEDSGHNDEVNLEVSAVWISNNELVVYRDPRARVFEASKELLIPFSNRTVKIQFREPTKKKP